MKNFFRNIHLYLSLVSGLVIAIVCFTGAVLEFQTELQMALNPNYYSVSPSSTKLPLEELVKNFESEVPKAKVSGVKVYSDPTRSVEFSFKDPNAPSKDKGQKAGGEHGKAEEKKGQGAEIVKKGKGGPGGHGGGKREAMLTAFMNPYTGQLLGTYNYQKSFFFTMFSLHRWLLADEVGKMIVGVCTVFFLFILITGIILWWPKNKKIMKQRLTMKLSGGWKRINHDLHIVVGFYAALFLFIFAFTGLAWSFEWFNNAIYTVTGTENARPEPPTTPALENVATISLDNTLRAAQKWEPNAEFYNFGKPKEAGEAITVTAMPENAVHERASNQLFLNAYTGEKLSELRYADKNLGQRVRATFYPVHVGSIGGMVGRIIAFLACLAGTTFPITGIILWLNRLSKERRKKSKTRVKHQISSAI